MCIVTFWIEYILFQDWMKNDVWYWECQNSAHIRFEYEIPDINMNGYHLQSTAN